MPTEAMMQPQMNPLIAFRQAMTPGLQVVGAAPPQPSSWASRIFGTSMTPSRLAKASLVGGQMRLTPTGAVGYPTVVSTFPNAARSPLANMGPRPPGFQPLPLPTAQYPNPGYQSAPAAYTLWDTIASGASSQYTTEAGIYQGGDGGEAAMSADVTMEPTGISTPVKIGLALLAAFALYKLAK